MASKPNTLAERFPSRALQWQLRSRTIALPRRPLVMGIVNVTPDSFSDGGKFLSAESAIEQGLALAAAGADLLDIGGESTRPYAEPVSAAEELRRVLPVVIAICDRTSLPVSIDTSKASVAEAAVAAGAEIINDVTGLSGDPNMLTVARVSGASMVIMHMQGTPQTMQVAPHYDDVTAEILDYLRTRRDALIAAGIAPARICLDPGIGFGKTHQHNLTLLANCWRFHELGSPILVGHSRKGFISKVLGDKAADTTAGTIGVACSLAAHGVQIIRVHDVAAIKQALKLFEASGGIDGQAGIV